MNEPKVSIITINYNCNNYLQEHFDSVKSLDYDNWEHIFVDCGSTDGSLDTIKKNKHDKLIFYQIDYCTVSVARNFAINKSSGTICAILDSDDLICKNRLKSQVNLLESNIDTIVVGGNFIGLMNRSNVLAKYFLNKKVEFYMPRNRDDINSLINSAFLPFPHSTFTFKKSDFLKIGGYKIDKSEDFELLLKLSTLGRILSDSNFTSIINFGRINSHSSRYKPYNRTPLHYAFFSLLCQYNVLNNFNLSNEQIFSKIDSYSYIDLSVIQTKWLFQNLLKSNRLFKDRNLLFLIKLFIRNVNSPSKLLSYFEAPLSPDFFLKQ